MRCRNCLLAGLIACMLLAVTGGCSFGFENTKVCPTDVLARLDGMPIQCYNLGGRTAVVLDEIERYGFTKNWDEEKNTIEIKVAARPEKPDLPEVTRGSGTDGKKLGSFAAAAETVRINGVKIPGYRFGESLCAMVEDLGSLPDAYNQECGYSDYCMKTVWNQAERTVDLEVFRFPQVPWEESYAEKEAMVMEAELELYTKAPPEEALYYGAALEPRAGTYAGITADSNGQADGTGRLFDHGFAVYSNYVEFDEGQDFLWKPGSQILPGADSLCLMPWNTMDATLVFENEEYIRRTLDNLAAYHKPVIVRFGGEMNIDTRGDSPVAFVKAYRKIADIVHTYPGFATMWSPNDMSALDRPMSLYYPGDSYVDWIGVSSFIKRDFMGNPDTEKGNAVVFMTGDYAWHTNSLKPVIRFMEENNIQKPLAISEGAISSRLNYADGDDLFAWGEPRLRAMYWNVAMRYPQVKMITYFSSPNAIEDMSYNLALEPDFVAEIEEALQNGPFLLNYSSQQSDYVFAALSGRAAPAAQVPVYAYAYLPEDVPESAVYQVDGQAWGAAAEIPFAWTADLSGLEDGAHTLTVVVQGAKSSLEKSLAFEKQGGTVRFAAQ